MDSWYQGSICPKSPRFHFAAHQIWHLYGIPNFYMRSNHVSCTRVNKFRCSVKAMDLDILVLNTRLTAGVLINMKHLGTFQTRL